MKELIKIINDWARTNHGHSFEMESEQNGKYTVLFHYNNSEESEFTIEQIGVFNDREMVRIVYGYLDVVVEMIPTVIGSVISAHNAA